MQAALCQWVKPKALVVGLSAIAVFVNPDNLVVDLIIVVAVFATITLIAVFAWTGFGVAMSRFLQDPRRRRIFNIVMALLLVASIVPMVWI